MTVNPSCVGKCKQTDGSSTFQDLPCQPEAPSSPTNQPVSPEQHQNGAQTSAQANGKEIEDAIHKLIPHAEKGDRGAQQRVGELYRLGLGVPQNYAEAVRWFRRAAEQGDVEAQLNLAGMYFNGQGVPQDYARAISWTRKAAEKEDPTAQTNLGLF